MKKLLLIISLLVFAVPATAQQSIKSGGGEVSVSRTGQINIKSRPDKATTVAGKLNACIDAGSSDTYACSVTPAIASYITGQIVWVKAATANTGAATVNVNALGAKTIKKVAGGVTTDLATNDVRAGQWLALIYDGTNFQLMSASGLADANSGGTVTEVTGTANQINVATGTATPALTLSSTIVAPGTITVTTSVASPFYVSTAADPADAGAIRLGNNQLIIWEKAVTGTDWSLGINASDVLESTAPVIAPGLTLGSGTALTRLAYYTATLSPAEVAINTCAEQTFTVTGITAGDVVFVNKPTAQAGLGVAGVRASGANEVGINFCNVTGGAITPTASQAYVFGVLR